MANTTNFNWATPDDTDLVKDGAAAIRTLGSSIDTSLVDLKGGTTGQILSKASNTDLDYNWITNDVGDITEVQAGTGISVASGTGPIPIVTNTVATEFDAKGDLVVGTGADTFDRLAVGNNGETLVADSSTTTGLRYREDYAAGKNKIINGDFRINQRQFTSTTTSNAYGFDRFRLNRGSGGTVTFSAEVFTPGSAPLAGYEAINYARIVTASQSAASDRAFLQQFIEDARTFANQIVTVSFWAKASTGTPNIALEFTQSFGTGGSPSSAVTGIGAQKFGITSSWVRYSKQVTIPSVSGKTFGTDVNSSSLALSIITSAGSDFNARTDSLGNQDITVDLWGFQVEAGSVATAFQTATGTLAGELAACQRYYYRQAAAQVYSNFSTYAPATSTTVVDAVVPLPVTMRVVPTSVDSASIAANDNVNSPFTGGTITITGTGNSTNTLAIRYTHGSTALTQYRSYALIANNTTAAYLGFSAEL